MSNCDSINDFPFNVWNSIVSTLSSVISEDDVIAETKRKKCSALLDNLLKNRTWLVPINNPHSNEYITIEDDRIRFSTWLFGQLFSVFLKDCFDCLRKKCLDTQIELLHYLWENDPAMYGNLLRCYLDVYRDLCTVENAPITFKWFDVACQNAKLKLWKTNFQINTTQQVNKLLNLTLSLLIPQVQHISHTCNSISALLWKNSLSLLRNSSNRSLVYKLIMILLSEDAFFTHRSQFNLFIAELLLRILNDLSTLCQSGKLNEEEDFCAMLNTLREKLYSDAYYDFSYVHKMHCLLQQCQLTFKKSTEITIFQFLDKLKELSGFDLTTTDLVQCTRKMKRNLFPFAVNLFKHSTCGGESLDPLHEQYLSEDPKIREKIVENTPYIIFSKLDDDCYEFDEAVFNKYGKCLRAITLQALVNEDESLQYVCLKATAKIGCVPLEITLRPCVVILVILMLNATSSFSALAKSCIQQIGIVHDVDQEDHIYLKYAEQVFPYVVHTVVTNFSVYNVSLTGLTCDHASIFNRFTANRVLQYLLPYVARDPRLHVLVTELATLCDVSVAQLLRNAFKQIFPHIMLFEDMETVQSVMNILCKETNSTISELLSCCVTKVLAELFMYYEKHEQKVKYVLCEIKRLATSKMEKTPPEITTPDVESFLQSRFFGILMKLENQLCSDMTSQTAKRQVLSSFKSIIQFMSGAYITSVRFKVLFTLRTISDMEREVSPTICIDIWDTFVRKLDTNVLGPIISNIFVSLLPFVETHYDQINAIFQYLVVENRNAVSTNLLELYFVQAQQCDPVVFRIISQSETILMQMNVEERLEWLLEATKHEITEIKLQALRRLKHELANNRKDLSQLILASDSVSNLIFRVLDALVDGFRNLDSNIQEASGACLGEFGAIDPSYIPNRIIKEEDNEKYNCYTIDDVKFVVKAFTLLCRGFQMAKSSSNMDTFALAIQSLLTSYEVKQDENCKYWSQIPKNLREIIQPFYSTTYILTNVNESSHDIPHLVYGSNKAQTVQKWTYNWSNFLISLLPAESKAREVFTYCKGPMSCEIKCMQLFLPHILLNAVLASDSVNLTKIYEEMISVIRYNKKENENSFQKSSTQLIASEELSVISNTDMEMGIICTKTMFNLLDVLHKYYRDLQWSLKGRKNADCDKLKTFLSKFSKYQLTEKSFERKEYIRSLLYLEEHLAADGVNPDKHLVLLAKIYVYLNDVDNVKGLFAKYGFKLHQLQNVIMLHEITDQYQDAAICYQQLLKTTDKERALGYERRMIQCYLAMNQPETALRFVNSLSSTDGKGLKSFYDVECEALWNLSQYDKLELLSGCKSAQLDDSWGVRIGQSIVHFLKGNRVNVDQEFRRIRETLTKLLHMSTAAFGSYRESYEHAVKLHILNEFEKVTELVYSLIEDRVSADAWKSLFQSVIEIEFEERLNKLQPTSKALQPVLNIRQTLFDVAGRLLDSRKPELASLFHDEKRKCWLKVIEIANRTRNFQLAYSNIIAIDNYQLKGFFIEKAKYYWEKNEQQEALRTLQHGLEFHFSNFNELCKDNTRFEDKKICSEGYILMGTYNDTMANTDYVTNLQYFHKAYEVCKHSEKSLLRLAQYQDKILKNGPASQLYRTQPEKYTQVMEMYGQSLKYGCEFIYQSLSRALNVWMDFGVCLNEDRNKQSRPTDDRQLETRKNAFMKMTSLMGELIQTLPTYYFLTAFSLIMSRLCHPLTSCFSVLQQIVIECTLNFSNQSLWQFMSLYGAPAAKGTDMRQSERVNKILNDTNLTPLLPVIDKFKQLFHESLRLCQSSKNGKGPVQISSIVRRESLLLQDGHFDQILVPYQKFLTIVLPRSMGESLQPDATYNPFPEKMVFIASVRRQAYVYASMQKPIRVTLVGTDGQLYPMIFKSQDDMRIDSRAMEFNSVVNMYLKRDVESRDRGLHIRTYTVLPLPKKCGIIEFIPGLETIRSITTGMRRCLGMSEPNTSQLQSDTKDSLEKKRKHFLILCKLYPGVLQNWYKMEFPNPSSWYSARTSYVRTLAVMSIVGYVLGLGDRHNDNIMIDATNGDIVHVDFNALFNKGETLGVPERVPFRLTHSMVKAMGPLGYEGAFVYTCEIVNRILRSRKDQLISVLNTFLYDPLDYFTSGDRDSSRNLIVAAQNNLQNVELRLSGSVRSYRKGNSIPLSVEGQTRKLIEEATDVDNLCQMFFGWGAYM